MPRPQKKRFVCCMPKYGAFTPEINEKNDCVFMTVDEYETIRLIDLEKNTQQECANQMHVSRTTIQSVYESARRKVADAIVNGKKLVINGGDYVTCNSYEVQCGRGCKNQCQKHQCRKNKMEE